MTAYTADLNATHNPATGTAPPATWGDLVRDNFLALGEAWTAFTPVWTTTGSAPTLGNATLTGKYKDIGKTRYVRIFFKFGSSSASGTGSWIFSLPAGSTPNDGTDQGLHGVATDASTADRYPIACVIDPNTASINRIATADTVANSAVTDASPFTWDDDDKFYLEGVYELA